MYPLRQNGLFSVHVSHTAFFMHLHYLHGPFGSNLFTLDLQLKPKLLECKLQILESTLDSPSMQESIFKIVLL